MRAVGQRALLAAALLWGAALILWLGSGRWSVVLLAAPLVFAVGDALAVRRKARLAAVVDAALPQLVSSDDAGAAFRAIDARIMERRDRLVGLLPPRLLAHRLLETPDGTRLVVRAELRRADADAIRWRVDRLRG